MSLPVDACPCQSGKKYRECCRILHQGKPSDSVMAVMRSRYAAYAMGKVGYILKTTHPQSEFFSQNNTEYRKQLIVYCRQTQFEGLRITQVEDGEGEAFVTFNALVFRNGQDASFNERSRFLRHKKRWLYVGPA